jgi:hypothetical protein
MSNYISKRIKIITSFTKKTRLVKKYTSTVLILILVRKLADLQVV